MWCVCMRCVVCVDEMCGVVCVCVHEMCGVHEICVTGTICMSVRANIC